MWIFAVIIFALLAFYFKIVPRYKYWEEKGAPYMKPLYIFGNFAETVFRLTPFVEVLTKIYNSHQDARYVGFYQFLKPTLMIRDPELIKKITIKDFDTFPEHDSFLPADADPLWTKNLFAMASKDGWHELRATLSPSFTSSKMRTMFTLMQECSTNFVNYLKSKDDHMTIEMKDAFSRFTNDVIGSTAFGVTCDSLKDKDNEFYLMGKEATNFFGIRGLKFLGYAFWPSLMKLLNIKIFNKKVSNFFRGLITETLKIRKEKKIVRPDMIHLLMEARKENPETENETMIEEGFAAVQESDLGVHVKKQIELTDENITAQALIFFFAGFESISTAMSYLSYELAIKPDIQTKLRHEIRDTLKRANGTITYELLLSMKYLDNIISETLRLHPPTIFTDRRCTKPYVIEADNPGETTLYLEKGSFLWIPIRAIQRDAKYFPNPEKFDPDRFNDENKHNIKPFTYIPFGAGPRNCIGSRFALLECKLIFAELLQNYELVAVEKTEIPLKLNKSTTLPLPNNGFWIGLNRIK